jgi:hypothetical protein
MNNSEFVARAMRDYLRPLVGETEVKHIDSAVNAGESEAAIFSAVSIAKHFGIALPPIFRDKIAELGSLPLGLDEDLLAEFDSLPTYWLQAS